MKRVWFAILVVLFCLGAHAQQADLQIAITDNHVTVSHLTAGATAVLWSVAQVGDGYTVSARLSSVLLPDTDSDGSVGYDAPAPMPRRSIWVAVDLTNGAHAVATPSGYATSAPNRPPLLRKHGTAVDGLASPSNMGVALYVSPGGGAWSGTITNGGELLLSDLKNVGGNAPPPAAFAAGDALFVIDTYDMSTYAATLTAGMLAEAN